MVSQDVSRRTWGQHPIRKTPPLKSSDHKVGLKFASGRNRDGSESWVRIYGVDTPERGEPCFEEATERFRELAGDRVIRSGRLPALKIGRTWVVNEEDLDELQKSYQGGKGRPPKRKD